MMTKKQKKVKTRGLKRENWEFERERMYNTLSSAKTKNLWTILSTRDSIQDEKYTIRTMCNFA